MLRNLRAVLSAAAFAGGIGGAAYLALALQRTRAFARRKAFVPLPLERPPVTILKPLRGATHELARNLASFANQDYPDFEVLFAVADPADAAVAVAREVIASAPGRSLRLVVGGPHRAANPKVANLMNALAFANGEVLVIADADVRVGPDYLKTLVAELAPSDAGAVTCLYGGLPTGSPWSRLGSAFIEERFAPSVLVAVALEPLRYAFGATIALRASTLAAAGGLAALADTIADDYRLGALVAARGSRVVLSSYVVHTIVDEPNLGTLWAHELRWARTIRAVRPAGFAGSILTHGCALALLALCLAPRARSRQVLLLTTFGLRFALAGAARHAFGERGAGGAGLIPAREALDLAVWVTAFLGRTASWQGTELAIGPSGRIAGARPEAAEPFT